MRKTFSEITLFGILMNAGAPKVAGDSFAC
jgi:hypothetical protein